MAIYIQSCIFYSGTVQGVGFRFTTRELASELSLSGWVKNLSDGRVEILAEGNQKDIEELMNQITEKFQGYIKDKEVSSAPASGKLKDFQIAF